MSPLNYYINSYLKRNSGSPFPTEGLQVLLNMQTYEDGGTTYYVNTKGTDIPVVSGTGLDTILDFSVLNDDRFDKGAYVGNAYGLPEYYNYPYVNIYYDDTSEATRYHWKLTDFHYANILAQTVDTDIQNNYFLKALATTDTSNEIASVQVLLVYSIAQTGENLTKLKTYIGIQNDFYGDNLIVNPSFETGDLTGWGITEIEGTVTITNISQSGYYAVKLNRTSGNVYFRIKVSQDFSTMIGIPYILSFWTRGDGVDSGLWSIYDVGNSVYYQSYASTNIAGTVYKIVNYNFIANSDAARLQLVGNNNSNLADVYYDNIICKAFYQNYYKS